ncbi:putative hydrolase of alpha/beta superfamily [Bernardetia litoralis DSM 6794]|uniref:Putative hydrolase of alpha/beta superfamily n=1 Tax=Bernardetia litoralis (strain ATCC 23117 / DSM 6794 / NBRC 15988 / NCIMB 1366 / Fx l1 / Sio-4) TaxID=880071 RepID=I4AQ94_BERLS|nr:alpha/beta hydrolase-fold protein [Bernardetia litoralis]AFM06129.1 putative hydrolase of alpha/beta superfamily [Bernardetia litoralis DSM 6794]
MRNVIVFVFCLISFVSQAQKIEIGEVKTIQSEILNEEREYFVSLPENYSNKNFANQKYPVIYLLDGERYFNVTTGIVQKSSEGYYPLMPECIVVGIKNTNRSRDLTPTNDSTQTYESGGSDNFEAFIIKELIPQINNNYKVLDYKILIGHSFGGLFAFNILLKKPSEFNAYIVLDPSLWWGDNILVKKLESNLETIDFKGSSLFFANANSKGNQKEPSKQHLAHFEAKNNTLKLMEVTTPKNLNYHVKFYNDEDHGSVVLPALIDGLRTIFKGFRINVKELVKDPSLLEKQYDELSSKIGFSLKPQAAYIDRVVDLAIKRGEEENAIILNTINKKLYPNNIYLKNKFN